MFLCSLRHSRISDRTEGNLTAKKIVSNLSLLFIPTDQTKRPPCKTCIIHCSYDESLLISHVFKKRSRLFEIFIEDGCI